MNGGVCRQNIIIEKTQLKKELRLDNVEQMSPLQKPIRVKCCLI